MTGQNISVGALVRELRRRKVVRTCVLYVVVCWGILQVGDIVFPVMGLDADTASRNALYLLIVGFPVTFAIAWFFQISANGIVRTTSFVERRVLNNISPINDRRSGGVTTYFRKDEPHPDYKWILSAETGPLAGLSFGVTDTLLLGRALDCDVALVSQAVSRHHAKLCLDNGELSVEDLGSANGTVVNGKKISGDFPLHNEDELRFHDIVFRVTQSFSGAGSGMDAMNQTTFIESSKLDTNLTEEK